MEFVLPASGGAAHRAYAGFKLASASTCLAQAVGRWLRASGQLSIACWRPSRRRTHSRWKTVYLAAGQRYAAVQKAPA